MPAIDRVDRRVIDQRDRDRGGPDPFLVQDPADQPCQGVGVDLQVGLVSLISTAIGPQAGRWALVILGLDVLMVVVRWLARGAPLGLEGPRPA
ncbi:MAG: hypothetical protein WKF75_04440 [Singulisphaera sp.]